MHSSGPIWRRPGGRGFLLAIGGGAALVAIALANGRPIAAQNIAGPGLGGPGFARCQPISAAGPRRPLTAKAATDYLNVTTQGSAAKGAKAPLVKPTDVAVLDFNGDGCDDIAQIDRTTGASHVQVLIGTGDGSFTYFRDLNVNATVTAMTAADVDRDGFYDLALGLGGARTGVLVYTGALLTNVGSGPYFTALPAAPQKLAGLTPETGRLFNWAAIFDEVADFEEALVAAAPAAGGGATLFEFPFINHNVTIDPNAPQPYTTFPLNYMPTALAIGPVGSINKGQVPKLGAYVGGPQGVEIFQFDNTNLPVDPNAAPEHFRIGGTANPRKIAISLDSMIASQTNFFAVSLGYGVVTLTGSTPDAVNIQGFVTNTHTNAFDLSVFGFQPQEINTATDGGGVVVAETPSPQYPYGAVTWTKLTPGAQATTQALPASAAILPGASSFAFGNFNGVGGTPSLLTIGADGLNIAPFYGKVIAFLPANYHTDLSLADQYIQRQAISYMDANATQSLSDQQWKDIYGIPQTQGLLYTSMATTYRRFLDAYKLDAYKEETNAVIAKGLSELTSEYGQVGGPRAARVDQVFEQLGTQISGKPFTMDPPTPTAVPPENPPRTAATPTNTGTAAGAAAATTTKANAVAATGATERNSIQDYIDRERDKWVREKIEEERRRAEMTAAGPLTAAGLTKEDEAKAAAAIVGDDAGGTACEAGGGCTAPVSDNACTGGGMCQPPDQPCTAGSGCFDIPQYCEGSGGCNYNNGTQLDPAYQDVATGKPAGTVAGSGDDHHDDDLWARGFDPLLALRRLGQLLSAWLMPLPDSARAFAWLEPGTVLIAAEQPNVSIVANGNSQGDALELQVVDPSGAVKKVSMPEGVALQALKQKSKNPIGKPAKNMTTQAVGAYCLEYLKLPPAPGTMYRIAGGALQNKYAPVRSVLQAGRMMQKAGLLHPDSNPLAYVNSIKQYAVWTKLGNWDQKKFGEVLLEKTKDAAKNAKANFTPQMETALMNAVPGRWRDVTAILDQAKRLTPRR